MGSRDERAAYHKWQRRLAKRLPDLAARTFALRGKMYLGCGFHYSLERTLGNVIRIASGYDLAPGSVADEIINKVVVEGFHKDLAAAEISARNLAA